MLQKSSPNLEELSIEGSFPHPINAFQIANARWKNLRKINIGDLRIESLPIIADPTTKAPFIEFLEAHPKLQSLKFSRHTIHPSHFSHLGPETLPCVMEFSGTLEQLQQLPHIHPRLKSVTFLDPIRSRPVTTATMAAVLQNLPALVNLRVSFALHSMYDSTSFLRSLIAACPQLENLELTCSDVPSFQLVRRARIRLPNSILTLLVAGHLLQEYSQVHKTATTQARIGALSGRRSALLWRHPHRTLQSTSQQFQAYLSPAFAALALLLVASFLLPCAGMYDGPVQSYLRRTRTTRKPCGAREETCRLAVGTRCLAIIEVEHGRSAPCGVSRTEATGDFWAYFGEVGFRRRDPNDAVLLIFGGLGSLGVYGTREYGDLLM